MKSFFPTILVLASGLILLSGNIAKSDKEDDKTDAYLLGKAKLLNESNLCEEIEAAYRSQQARLELISHVPELKGKPAFNDLTKAIQFNLEKLDCIQKKQIEFCSWNLEITDPVSYKKYSSPMNLYLISILSDEQLKQMTKDMPPGMRDNFLAYQKQITELKKYFSKRKE